jgi:hypothetical protein
MTVIVSNPNPPDKPGKWKFHEVQGPNEARVKIQDLISDGYKVAIVAYKYNED